LALHSPQQQKFSSSKIHRWGRKKLCSPYLLWEPPLRHDWYNDSNAYSHWKLCLCAKRHVFNNVDWFNHYTWNGFELATLKLECSLKTCPTNLYLTYWLTSHMLPITSCRLYQSLRRLYVSNQSMFVITFHHLVHSFMPHFSDLITMELWPTALPSTLLTTFMRNDTHNILPPLLTYTNGNKVQNQIISFPN